MSLKLIFNIQLLITSIWCTSGIGPIAKDSIPKNYRVEEIPDGKDGAPLEIKLKLYLESIGKVDEGKMEMEVHGYLSQIWTDSRLNRTNGSAPLLIGNDKSLIWTPDIYCSSCRRAVIGKRTIRIDSNGGVYLSEQASLWSICYMDLRQFPFDDQQCNISFTSYGYNHTYIKYNWTSLPILKNRKLPQFDIASINSSATDTAYPPSGEFHVLSANFNLKRRMTYYMIQCYLPCMLLVMLSWIVFLMHPESVASRNALAITVLLTLVFLAKFVNQKLPTMSYVKAIDVYIFYCILTICFSLTENIIVYGLHKMHKRKSDNSDSDNSDKKTTVDSADSKDVQIEEEKKSMEEAENVDGKDEQIEEEKKSREQAENDESIENTNSGSDMVSWFRSLVVTVDGENNKGMELAENDECVTNPNFEISVKSSKDLEKESPELQNDKRIGIFGRVCKPIKTSFNKWCNRWPIHRMVDMGSRIIFPGTFIFFNIVYFPYYFNKGNRQISFSDLEVIH